VETEASAVAREIRSAQMSGNMARLRNAIFRAGQLGTTAVGAQVLEVAQHSSDERVLENSAWALGKIGYSLFRPLLRRLLQHRNSKIRLAAAWALGEVGTEEDEGVLREAQYNSEDGNLRATIGGALKKLKGKPVRAYAGSVERRLRPPPAPSGQLAAIVDHLENFDWASDQTEVIRLRKQLQSLDPEYFRNYMQYRSDRSAALAVLHSSRVYRRIIKPPMRE
jgi:hypothetical protein